MTEDNEQWLSDGICSKCRRQSYCSKPCTRSRRRTHAIIKRAVAEKMDAMTGGIMTESIYKTLY